MIRFSLFTFSALCLGAALAMGNASLASAAQPAPVMQQAPLLSRLSNGMKVLIQRDDRFPLVSLRLYVHTGSVFETPNQAGISHLLEHMVFKGTEHRPKGAVAGDIEKFGGYVNAATSYDYTVYLADMPAARWREGLDVLRDMAFFPTIDAQELASEKEVVLAELQTGFYLSESCAVSVWLLVQSVSICATTGSKPCLVLGCLILPWLPIMSLKQ